MDNSSTTVRRIGPGLEQQAIEWLARLDAPTATAQDRAAFEHWCAADLKHRAAYLRVEANWRRLDRLQMLKPAAGKPDPNLIAGRQTWMTPQVKTLAATVLLAILGTTGWWYVHENRSAPSVYSTSVGGFERVKLADGSSVELNTDSEIEVRFEEARRTIRLRRGEAHFDVARDPHRPFTVMAGAVAIRALGTAFNVRMREQRVDVYVTDGQVALGPSQVVRAGQAASADKQGTAVRELNPAQSQRELAWQSGLLSFEGDALSEVIMEINRYNSRPLVIRDSRLNTLKVGGYFKATDPEAVARALQESFGIHFTTTAHSIELR